MKRTTVTIVSRIPDEQGRFHVEVNHGHGITMERWPITRIRDYMNRPGVTIQEKRKP
jgi:hypothetical protein